RTVNEKTSHERRFYLSSLAGRPEQILAAVRQHWEVENKLHWMLDVVFGEDDHRYAKDHGPENLAVLRHMALNLLNREPSKGGMKRKRKRAALSDEFRSTLLMLLLQP
uniref:ISAs1 family transposase n=2 Tax=Deinococcus misasensis TaxID=392413 RepID=UPI0005504F50